MLELWVNPTQPLFAKKKKKNKNKNKTTIDTDIFPLNLGELMGANPTLPDLICMSIAINLVFYKILLHHIRYKIDKYSNFLH